VIAPMSQTLTVSRATPPNDAPGGGPDIQVAIETKRQACRRDAIGKRVLILLVALRGKKWVKARASCQFNPKKSRIFEVFTGLETCHVLRHEKAA